MIQYCTLNVKLSNSLHIKLKLRIKNGTKVSLNPSSDVLVILIMGVIFLINYSHKLLLIITQVSRLFRYTSFVKLLHMVHQLI